MKDAVVIKSYQNGITLILNDELSFEEILDNIRYKFREARHFFGSANVALSLEGKMLSNSEELDIVEAIRENSDVRILCLVGRDEETNRHYIKALQKIQEKMPSGSEGQFYKGSLTDGETMETENSIIIMGDVYPGCTVVSTKNILIIGGLYGEAYAGGGGNEDAYVVALEMAPERLKIGDFRYKAPTKPRWGLHPKIQPKIAYVKNDKIVFEPLTKELLDSF